MKSSSSYLITFSILLSFSGSVSNAQSNFIEGYYVTTQHDTIHGFIVNRSAYSNFFGTLFKLTQDTDAQPLDPTGIESFTIANSMMFEKHTYKEKDGTDLTGFFKVEVRGKLTLLTNGKRYFAVRDRDNLLEITGYKEVSGTIISNRTGLGILKVLMSDCPTTDEAYLRQQYSNKNLKKIFVTYNECIHGNAFVSKDVKAKTKLNFGLQALPSIVTMNSGYLMEESQMSWSKTLVGGAFVSIFFPGGIQNMKMLLEINYYKYSGYGYYHYQNRFQSLDVNNDAFVKYQALQVPLLARFGDKFFADFGIQNHLNLHTDLAWRTETIKNNAVTTDYVKSEAMPRFWTTGLLAGGGMKFNVASFPVRVFLRYSRNGNPFFSSKPGYQMASMGVSFQFTKN